MRTTTITKNVLPVAAIVVVSSFAILFPFFSSQAQKAKVETVKEEKQDDTSKAQRKTITIRGGDVDKMIADLDKSMIELQHLNLDEVMKTAADALKAVDLTAIQKSVEDAVKSVNADQIQQQVKLALEQVNGDSIQRQIQLSIKSLDTDKMKADLDKAMTELKNSHWQEELQKGMKEMHAAMAEMKNINATEIKKELENARHEMEQAKLNMKDEMDRGRINIEKARAEILQLKTLLQDLQKDGLIKKGEDVKLEWKNSRLYINGKEQSSEISEKYKALGKMDINMNSNDDL